MQQHRQQLAFDRAVTFLKNGDAATAEQLCVNALQEYPEDPNFLCLSARALIMLGKYSVAEERLNNAITLFPDFSRPRVVRGELRLTQGRLQDAEAEFRRAIELGDDDPNTQIKLSRVMMLRGDTEAARQAVDESLRLDPVRARLAEAFELEKTGQPAEAEKIYRDILKRDPENVDALRLLAGTATSQKQYRDAEVLLKRALDLTPDFGRAMADLVVNLVDQEKIDEALEYANRLVRIGADNPDSHLLLGNALAAAGRFEDAIEAYRRSLQLSPKHPGALSGLAHNLKTLGRQDEAVEAYRRCISGNPYFTEAYWSLANLKTFRFTDEEVASMEELLAHPDVPEDAEVHLSNALGFEYESRGDHDKAFGCFSRCNAVRRRQEYYDPVETESLFDRIIKVFDRDLLSMQTREAPAGPVPIFIVGLPRSGSTLLEQILASHSMVEGTHELSDLGRVVQEIPALLGRRRRFPESLAGVDARGFAALGARYLERTARYRGDAPYFTDKNPNNFSHIGLIHLALPHAVVIDARRHPLDSCLGTWKQLFAKGQPFSYDLAEVGEYYLQYARLMAHWHDVLPGKVLEVRYEDVVDDLDSQVRRILGHCGLPFEQACVEFHRTERAVKTASSEQVRQPIYRSSVDLWRHYEPHLGPLIDILEPVLMKLSELERPAMPQPFTDKD